MGIIKRDQNEWALIRLAYEIKVYAQKRGITIDELLLEIKEKLGGR